jgi:hypothetical protein
MSESGDVYRAWFFLLSKKPFLFFFIKLGKNTDCRSRLSVRVADWLGNVYGQPKRAPVGE